MRQGIIRLRQDVVILKKLIGIRQKLKAKLTHLFRFDYNGPLAAKEITPDRKSRFRERKVARKPGMLPQTNLLKCMRSS